jgi:hypothetical protein
MGDDHYSEHYSGADDEQDRPGHRRKATHDMGSQYQRDESRYDMRTLGSDYDGMDNLQHDERLGGIPYASGKILILL